MLKTKLRWFSRDRLAGCMMSSVHTSSKCEGRLIVAALFGRVSVGRPFRDDVRQSTNYFPVLTVFSHNSTPYFLISPSSLQISLVELWNKRGFYVRDHKCG